jgi:hypothetical protein
MALRDWRASCSTSPRGDAVESRTPKPESQVIRHVLSYFLSRPESIEDLEHVARWRLPSIAIAHCVAETHDAIAWLVEQGLLERVKSEASGSLFRLKNSRRQEAGKLLARLSSDES